MKKTPQKCGVLPSYLELRNIYAIFAKKTLQKTIDKCTWQRYNEDTPRKLGSCVWRFVYEQRRNLASKQE